MFQYSLSVNKPILNTTLSLKLAPLFINSEINNRDINMYISLRTFCVEYQFYFCILKWFVVE